MLVTTLRTVRRVLIFPVRHWSRLISRCIMVSVLVILTNIKHKMTRLICCMLYFSKLTGSVYPYSFCDSVVAGSLASSQYVLAAAFLFMWLSSY